MILRERDRRHFDSSKAERELCVVFRPVEETLADEVAWYRRNGWLQDETEGLESKHPAQTL
jgi:dihydroflavonol-4-reductase